MTLKSLIIFCLATATRLLSLIISWKIKLFQRKYSHSTFISTFAFFFTDVINFCLVLFFFFKWALTSSIKWHQYRKSGVYPSSFANVRFWKKIEFSHVIFCQKQSQNYLTVKVVVCRYCKLCRGFIAEP